jgi:hypothetical protein
MLLVIIAFPYRLHRVKLFEREPEKSKRRLWLKVRYFAVVTTCRLGLEIKIKNIQMGEKLANTGQGPNSSTVRKDCVRDL